MNLTLPSFFPVASHTDQVGKGSTFVAIPGRRLNGTDFIEQAVEKGASKIVVQEDAVLSDKLLQGLARNNVALIRVPNARKALALLSAEALDYPAQKLKIFGITGTKGKTTTAFLLEHVLRSAGYATALLSTVRNRIKGQDFPTALTTQQPDYLHVFFDRCVQAGVTHVVMEVSAQALSLHRIEGISFDGIIFTNFSQEHAEFYASLEDYFAAKKNVFSYAKPESSLFINGDDAYGKELLKIYDRATSFGLDTTRQVYATLESSGRKGLQFSMHDQNKQFMVNCPSLIGTYNVYNVLGALALAMRFGIAEETALQALQTFNGAPGRMESYQLSNGALCVIDYAHTPSSFEAILTSLRQMADKLIIVFGCGGDRDPIKRPEMGRIAAEFGDHVFITSDNPRSEDLSVIMNQIWSGIRAEHQGKVVREPNRELALREAYGLGCPGSIIALLGKGPDEYEEVNGVKTYFSERAIMLNLDIKGDGHLYKKTLSK